MSAVAQSVKMLTDVQKKYTFCKCNGVSQYPFPLRPDFQAALRDGWFYAWELLKQRILPNGITLEDDI